MALSDKIQNTESRMHQIKDEIEGVGQVADTEGRDISQDELTLIDELSGEYQNLEQTRDVLKKAHERTAANAANKAAAESQNALSIPESAGGNKLPAVACRERSKIFENNAEAYAMGRWLFGLIGDEDSKQFAMSRGFKYHNAQEVGTPGAGGYTVPTPLAAEIIRLVQEYSVYPRFSRNMPMSAMTLDVPKRTTPLTVYYPGEGNAITASDLAVEQVNLVAKKYALLNIMSTELVSDALISWTDLIAQEFAWSTALAIDTNSFLGDGTATFGGITGIANALQAGSLLAGGAGLWGGVTLTQLEQLAGLPPAIPGFQGRWYMSKYAYFNVVMALLHTAGGTDMRQVEQGGELMLMGYPVTWTQVLAGADGANGDLGIVFGDLSLGSMYGDRRSLSIRILDQLYAASDQLGMVCTSRSDSVIHDVGDATNAGTIVGLTLST